MKHTWSRCLAIALVLLLGVSLSAIAGGKQEAAGGKAAVTEITVWCMAFDPHVNGYTNVIEAFNKNTPTVKVVLEPQPGQAEMVSKMRASLSSGRGAQAFTTPGTTLTEWAVPGNIQPVSPAVVTVEQVKKDFLPENYIQCNLKNQIWAIGIPDPPGDCGVIVNVKHLKDAGLAVKQKFDSRDELLSYGKKLAKYEGNKLVRGGLSFQESNDPNFIYSYIVEIGGKFWNNDTQKFNLETPQAKEVLQFFYDISAKHKLDSVELPDTLSALSQNLTSMGFMWPEFLPFASSTFPDLELEFIMKPPFKQGNIPIFSHTDTWNVVVPSYVKDAARDGTFAFLKYLISEEGQKLFLDANPGFSPLKKLTFNDPYYTTGKGKYLAPVISAVKAGQYRYWGPFIDADVMLYDIMWPNVDALLHGQTDVAGALAKMQKELNDQDARTRAKYPDAPKTMIFYEGFPADLKP